MQLELELEETLSRKDLNWRQNSRELWSQEGDRNTKFFHLSTLIERQKMQSQQSRMKIMTGLRTQERYLICLKLIILNKYTNDLIR